MQFIPSSPPMILNHHSNHNSAKKKEGGLLPAFKEQAGGIKIHEDDRDDYEYLPAMGSSSPIAMPKHHQDNKFLEKNRPTMSTFYPSPLPSSTTGEEEDHHQKPNIKYAPPSAQSRSFTIRSPLASVALLRLPRNGTPVTIGRSSKSSDIALSSKNKNVSRVHAKTKFEAKDKMVVIDCLGWNGIIVYVPLYSTDQSSSSSSGGSSSSQKTTTAEGQDEYGVVKGQTICIEYVPGITIEVCKERVLIEVVDDVPKTDDDETEDEELPGNALTRSLNSFDQHVAEKIAGIRQGDDNDDNEQEDEAEADRGIDEQLLSREQGQVHASENVSQNRDMTAPHDVVAPQQLPELTMNKPEEKNGVKRGFIAVNGEAGNSKKRITHKTNTVEFEKKEKEPSDLQMLQEKPQEKPQEKDDASEKNMRENIDYDKVKHVIANHLAYSRLSSTPVSIIQKSNSQLVQLEPDLVVSILKEIPCVGVIPRSGKDAAGKRLEDEYYYMPDKDTDEHRKLMVEQSRGHGGLRACRKTHKQYFWKKPTK